MPSNAPWAARVVAAAELPLVLAMAPLLIFPTPGRALVLAIVPVIWGLAWLGTGRFVPSTPLNRALGFLLLMVAVSVGATFDVTFSLGKIAGALLGIVLFWAVVRWVRSQARLSWAVAAYVLAGVTLSILGLLGARWEYKFMGLRAVAEQFPAMIRGVPGAETGFNPNAVGGCLVLFVPLQIALLVSGADRRLWPAASTGGLVLRRAAQAAALVLTAGALVLMQARGAWTGVFVATFAFLCWHSHGTRVASVLLAAVVGLTVLIGSQAGPLQPAFARIGQAAYGRLDDRVDIWSSAVRTIREFPVTGIGMNTFRVIGPIRHPMSYPRRDGVPHAHNMFLQAALDLGIPGLLAYLAIWISTAGMLVRVYRASRDPVYRALAGGLGAGGIAHFVFGLSDVIPLGAKVGVLFWLGLAMAAAVYRLSLERAALSAVRDDDGGAGRGMGYERIAAPGDTANGGVGA